MMPRAFPPTKGGPKTPKPRLCEWCRERPAVRQVELKGGRKVKAGYKAAHTIHVCAQCAKTIERNRRESGE